MIIDRIDNTEAFKHLSWYNAVHEYLASSNLLEVEPGRYDIDGDDLYVIVADDTAREAQPPLEAHRVYIDLQLTLAGSFDILWRPLATCSHELRSYSEEDDVLLVSDPAPTRLCLDPGTAAVFFPEDAHAPQPPKDSVRKVIFKIRA